MDHGIPDSPLRVGTGIVLWTEQQEDELEMLYEEFKDSDGETVLLPEARFSSLRPGSPP